MAVIMAKPHPTLPPNHKPRGGIPYRVMNGDNWESVAKAHGIPAGSLIFFNFHAAEPKYVNYYLKHNVGCTTVSPDGKNYSFRDASPGIIYLPGPGSDFVWAAPPIDPVKQFFILVNQPQPEQHPTNHDQIRCLGFLEVSIVFNRLVPDVTRYVYRQFVRGRMRLRTNRNSAWFDETLNIPNAVGTSVPISPTAWLEDGIIENGVVRRYGHRETAPSLVLPHDFYSDPIVTTPPVRRGAVLQTGYGYRSTDSPGFDGIDKTRPFNDGGVSGIESINGISMDLEFRLEIWEMWDFRGLGRRLNHCLRMERRRLVGHFEVTSRTPVKFTRITRPEG